MANSKNPWLGRIVQLKVTRLKTDLGYCVEYELDDPALVQDLKQAYGDNAVIRFALPGEPWYVTNYDVSVYIDEEGMIYRVKTR